MTLINSLMWCATALAVGTATLASGTESRYPGASHVPESRSQGPSTTQVDQSAPLDEAQGGRTARGTPVARRNEHCFPAETRNLFSEVDKAPSGPNGALQPVDYRDADGVVSEEGRKAIRGQNTWILWAEGNEAFWGWLQEQGYGFVDFLVLLDSRDRTGRFKRAGMMNQPGMKAQMSPDHELHKLLGLYLDQADGQAITLRQPDSDVDASTKRLAQRPQPPPSHPTELFEAGDPSFYRRVLDLLPQDGVDPAIYGYPSGVVGLRLMPNPDFFGKTSDAARARRYWEERVVKRADAYYTNRDIAADPSLIRPFRVAMSCGFCHVGPHPLNPPADVDNPAWANMSSIIGNQYWNPAELFANLATPDNLIYHFLASQQRGTVDTSLVSTDHINNATTITAVWDVNARVARAKANPPEHQSSVNLLFPGLEDGGRVTPRHTTRVLLDGSDSIGVLGALSRVYLNIGTFPEEWARCHNPIIGFRRQRPFSAATLLANSAFWRAGEKYRIPYLASFFTYVSPKTKTSVTAPMKLSALPDERAKLGPERGLAAAGRDVFVKNCAICHSSIQPEGFELAFADEWAKKPVPKLGDPPHFTLPLRFEEWEAFRQSDAFKEYGRRIADKAKVASGGEDPFIKDNFLSTDIRVPVTLVGTNSGRAAGTNAMRGQVWADFSSEDYKSLPQVRGVRFYNPYSGAGRDRWGNNDSYDLPPGGPGYYRPASLISVWATAPYLHNNALGLFNGNPSVAGRLEAFNDGIDKLLWQAKRVPSRRDPAGDLRFTEAAIRESDPGFIYRVTAPSSIKFGARFIRPLVDGLIGRTATNVITLYLWIGLAFVAVVLAFVGRVGWAGFVLLLVAVGSAALLVVTRLDRVWPLLWLAPAGAGVLAVAFWLGAERRWLTRTFFAAMAVIAVVTGIGLHMAVDGRFGDLHAPPIPKGTPINLLVNVNPEAPTGDLIRALSALARGVLLSHRFKADSEEARHAFETEAGPALLRISKCPDMVLDRGHWFAEGLTDVEKQQLKAFLKTL